MCIRDRFRGKKYQESAKLIDKSAQYEAAEGMDLILSLIHI